MSNRDIAGRRPAEPSRTSERFFIAPCRALRERW
jgi:hypothetical protein